MNNKRSVSKKGNKNAVKTGEYEQIYIDTLTEQERQIYKDFKIEDKEDLFYKEYLTEYKIMTIREKRMLERISVLEAGIFENETLDKILKIEDALTRVQEAKRKSRENIIRLGFSQKTLALKEKEIESEIW